MCDRDGCCRVICRSCIMRVFGVEELDKVLQDLNPNIKSKVTLGFSSDRFKICTKSINASYGHGINHLWRTLCELIRRLVDSASFPQVMGRSKFACWMCQRGAVLLDEAPFFEDRVVMAT